MHTPKHIAIIGGGPAGLRAAEIIASAGHRVTIYDRMPSVGRKFLMAGRGGLNLTHSEPLDTFLTRYGDAAEWLAPHIHAFPPDALRTWCEGLGQETFVGSSGRIFPRSMKAAPLLRAWLARLTALGVQFAPRHHWQGYEDDALVFTNANHERVLVHPDATLLALGGASWPRLGSDGSWVTILAQCGVAIAPLQPANCGFTVEWSLHMARFAGEPLKHVTLSHRNIAQQGEVMITAQGIEGGAIYALSAPLREAIAINGSTILTLDLRPGMTHTALTEKLRAQPRANKSLSTYLRKAGFSSLAIALLRECTTPEQLAHATPDILATHLKSLPLILTGTTGMARAISTAGGIHKIALTDGFMLRKKPGTFATGEMLNWEAPTGGYLLQACLSTATTTAHAMLEYLKK